jgi:ABC-type transporter Mla subunit MlaD
MEFRKTLQQIDGINKEIAIRLIEKGYDSLEKLVDADRVELVEITGLSRKAIPAILEQAGQMLQSQQEEEESLAELSDDATKLKTDVEQLILNIRGRFDATNASKEQVKELRKEISRTLASLEKVEAALTEQLRRLSKGLAKADQKISEVSGLGVEEVVSGLKKARKKIENAVD